MLSPAVMWILGVAVVLLPFVLAYAFHGNDRSDAEGRRVDRTWRGRSLLPGHDNFQP